MQKFFTKIFAGLLVAGAVNAHAQVQWPTADSATIKASQFADTTQIFHSTVANPNPPAGFKGWISKGTNTVSAAAADSTMWIWKRNGRADGGAYYGTTAAIVSPTVANGVAVFNSDFLDTRGVAGNFGAGPSPTPHVGELISPIMNVQATADQVIRVGFHQHYRNFQSATFVHYSTDGGATWSEPINLNPTIAANVATANTSTTTTRKDIVLKGATGSANFRIKFVFDGDFYFWILDDITVSATNKFYDMAMDPFYSIPQSFYTPQPQTEPNFFLADVRNVGTKPMNGVKLTVKVWRADSTLVFSSTNTDYPASFPTDTAYENRLLPDSLNLANLPVGRYIGSYRVSGDSSAVDINPANDTVRFTFWVSDTTAANSLVVAGFGQSNYTKENTVSSLTRNADSYWTANEGKSWRYGNYYRFRTGNTTTVTTLTAFMDLAAASGNPVQGSLYEWRDANDDGIVQAGERELVAVADTTLPAAQPSAGKYYVFALKDLNTGGPFYPKDTTDYLAMVEYNAPNTTAVYVRGGFSNVAAVNYQAMRYVTDALGKPRYSIILGKTADSDWSTAGFTTATLTPSVRLNVLPFRFRVDAPALSADNKVAVFPNPVGNDMLTVDLDLVKAYDAAVRVTDIHGRIMMEQVIDKVQKTQIRVDVSELASGTYNLQILTADGYITKRFVVAK